jgi:type II secretory pathway pseudopilin PulG
VTLIEMLVTLAVLLIMMTLIVQVFQAATGTMSAAQAYQELDNQLRLLDSTIRSDLNGVTCRLTPPNDPKNNGGYLEYGENEFADIQGEDSDDYIRFTAKAPAGRPFTGRMWVAPAIPVSSMTPAQFQQYLTTQPITITSEYAEIIYFLRNGNLYRRVILVAPERQSAIAPSVSTTSPLNNPWVYKDPSTGKVSLFTFNPSALGSIQVSWQGVNDLSAHPAPRATPVDGAGNLTNSVLLNTLGDLTNRENRWVYQRFGDDFLNLSGGTPPDGLTDDFNGDNVPDYYPTLYPTVLGPTNAAGKLIYDPAPVARPGIGVMAFPYIFPGAYSRPQVLQLGNLHAGWIHSPEPIVQDPVGNPQQYDLKTLLYLQNLNHNPLDVGDNLSLPASGLGGIQTWWGFPAWRETLSPFWTDPTWQTNTNAKQPLGLEYQFANSNTNPPLTSTMLPDMTSSYRASPQLFNDGPFTPNAFFPLTVNGPPPLWTQSWEDDLIMTGVRSFDIKAYDNSVAGYVDLGWGDDLRLYLPWIGAAGAVIPGSPPGLIATPAVTLWPPVNPAVNALGKTFNTLTQTFAHEGRMPPLQADLRFDAQYGAAIYAGFAGYTGNVGDDNPLVFRLRRVWDSWSTEYTQAPATGVGPAGAVSPYYPFFPVGPPGATPPVYPSYPAPYPAPLRGIQIQIRVTDPSNQRVKTLTIRQDFTDKL